MSERAKDVVFNATVAILTSLCLAGVGYTVQRTAHKINAKANADIRAAAADERIATALERIADRADRGGLPKPSLLQKEGKKESDACGMPDGDVCPDEQTTKRDPWQWRDQDGTVSTVSAPIMREVRSASDMSLEAVRKSDCLYYGWKDNNGQMHPDYCQ